MCTMIVQNAPISGSGKGADGWFKLQEIHVSYDHPFHAPLDHALNIDFVNDSDGIGSRVAVELTPESARTLVKTILTALDRGKDYPALITPGTNGSADLKTSTS